MLAHPAINTRKEVNERILTKARRRRTELYGADLHETSLWTILDEAQRVHLRLCAVDPSEASLTSAFVS